MKVLPAFDLLFGSTITAGAPQNAGPPPVVSIGVASIFVTLPSVKAGDPIPAKGQPYIDNSGFVVISQ